MSDCLKEIIYEDNHLRVIFIKSYSKTLTITFTNMVNLANGLSVYAELPLKKFDTDVLGFMAKSPNWYPVSSMERVKEKIADILKDYSYIVGYGASMGGYAVIKYSNLFNLNKAIAFDPQYSISPRDVDDKTYLNHYVPSLHNDMKISEQDITKECLYYIVFDPYYDVDYRHVNKIKALIDNINIVNLRFSSHSTSAILASSSLLGYLLFSEIKESDLYKKIRVAKRNKSFYYESLIQRTFKKNPNRIIYFLKNEKFDFSQIKNELKSEIIRYAIKNKVYKPSMGRKLGVETRGYSKYLKTVHNDILVFNSLNNNFESYPLDVVSRYKYLCPILFKQGVVVIDVCRMSYVVCRMSKNNSFFLLRYDQCNVEEELVVNQLHAEQGAFLEVENRYLTPFKDGVCKFTATEPNRWEYFKPLLHANELKDI